MSKKLLAAIVATTLGCGTAMAQTTNNVENTAAPNATQTAPGGLTEAGKDAKDTAKGEYKARKKIAEANKELNKADCEVSADGSAERACKKQARAQAKADKAEAKMTYENEKKDIKANHSK
ncbi:hypothetical protein [Piscinibacter sp. HJYY11]|uniref:hypothetical protein n=1 Tax=Piscinibacter sp. HJYY11 TaxID=2801333 RepID=UPI00191ED9B6|nr:hypothetical protein [Piscinibacter sp. HJYY11]MBL0729735.1 hypothetical protein [Piscinibacter sp. HJYY11]